MRSKEQDPDYRFLQDPDIPTFLISKERIQKVNEGLGLTPFEKKLNFSRRFQLKIEEVQTVFSHPWSVELFEKLATDKPRDPKIIFNW